MAISVRKVEEALGADPVIDGHADDAVAGEAAAVVGRPRSGLEHAAGNPHHDRQPGRPRVGSPDVEVQAILAEGATLRNEHVPWRGVRQLGWLRAVGKGVAHAAPGLDRLRRPKPIGAKRRRRIGNSHERVHAVGNAAADGTMSGLNDHPSCARHARDRPDLVHRHGPTLGRLARLRVPLRWSIHPHRLDGDGDFHVVADDGIAGHGLVPTDP